MTPKPLPRLAKWTGWPEWLGIERHGWNNMVIVCSPKKCFFFSDVENCWYPSAYDREMYLSSGWIRIAVLKPTPTGR